MAGDVTIGFLERLSWLPERDASENGNLIAGQKYWDVYFSGGTIDGVTLINTTITNPIFSAPVALEDGGTGTALSDPGADRIFFWDESANQADWLIPGSGLVITDKTITVAGVGLGDVTGPLSSVNRSIAVFDGLSGKIIADSNGAFVDGGGNISATNLSGTNTGDQTITLSGSVTGSGTGAITTTFRNLNGLSVLGRSADSAGTPTEITAGTDFEILRRDGNSIAFGKVNLSETGFTTGALPISRGGSGQTTAANAFDAFKQAATTTYSGAVELATDAETQTGTDTARPVTPSNIRAALGFSKYFESAQQTITNAGALTIAHGLPASPKLIYCVLVCTSANLGYSINDEVAYGPFSDYDGANSRGLAVYPDATNIGVRYASSAQSLPNKSTGVITNITNASWRLVVRAWG